jgi:hypothetical protein
VISISKCVVCISLLVLQKWNTGSSVGTLTRLRAWQTKVGFSARTGPFLSRPAVRPIKPMKWARVCPFSSDKAPGAWSWILHLLLRLRMRGIIPPLLNMDPWLCAWLSKGQLYHRNWLLYEHVIRFRTYSPTQPPMQWVPGALSLGVKLTTHLHLVPRSKNEWSYTSTPPHAFMAWCSVKTQGQLYLYL